MVRGALLIAVGLTLVVASSTALAHPLHTSFATVTVDRHTGAVDVSLRAFADDFTAAAREWSRKKSSRSTSSPALGYALESLLLRDSRGRVLSLQSCGEKRVGDLMWICLRGRLSPGSSLSSVRSSVLVEKYSDQVNIVQASYLQRKSSLLFTAGDGEKLLR